MSLKLLSLFSGIGAFEVSLKELDIDYELVNFCEIDKFAVKSYCCINDVDSSLNLNDITNVDCSKIGDVDLITYGFPCQDISVAGEMKGLFDEKGELTRSGLFFNATDIIKNKQPKFAIFENVKNLTSKKFEKQFELILKTLEDIGYNNYFSVLNSKDFGVPQNRERVFCVSIRKDIDKKFYFPKGFKLEYCLKDFLEKNVDEKYFLSQKIVDRFNLTDFSLSKNVIGTTKAEYQNIGSREIVYNKNKVIGTLVSTDYKQPKRFVVNDNEQIMRIFGIFDKDNKKHQAGSVYNENFMCPTLSTMQGGYRQPLIIDKLKIRKVTPKECFRLMGFRDNYFDKIIGISDSQLYKQAGNSIVVDVLIHIFKELKNQYSEYFKTSI